MTSEHDHDLLANLPDDQLDQIEELRAQAPIETAKTVTAEEMPAGALPLVGGGLLLVSALRSVLRGQLRAIPKAIAGVGLVKYGLGKRRSGSGGTETFDPSTDVEDVDGGTEGKDVSDEAHAAAERPDSGQESQIDASRAVDDSSQLGEEGDTGSRIEFIDDAEGSKPDADLTEADPRRNTDDDDDEPVEIDVSEPAMAEETAEATGPDPEQAQPAQTDATEPEETPEGDASHMKVEPDDDEASDDGDGNEDVADADTDPAESEGDEQAADDGGDDESESESDFKS